MKKHSIYQWVPAILVIYIIYLVFLGSIFAEEKKDATLISGMIDRFEDGQLAVILIESKGEEIQLPKTNLPKGSQEGMWIILQQSAYGYTVISHDNEKTGRAYRKNARLRNKGEKSNEQN